MNPNLDILIEAVEQLGELADEMVFVGGCATGLLITDKAAPPIRITKDVDAIVQVASHSDYYQLSDRLRVQGFSEDISEDAPICRWKSVNGILLDVMPIDPEVLGFGNEWYESATKHAQEYLLPSGKQIKLISSPYFLITKLDAFEGRGKNDYLTSHDIEDIVAVFDGRVELVDEVRKAEPELLTELAKRFKHLLNNRSFLEAVYGHLSVDNTSQQRVSLVLDAMGKIANLASKTKNIWIIGCGDIGRRVADLFQQEAGSINGIVRSNESLRICEQHNIQGLQLDLSGEYNLPLDQFKQSDVFYFAPPPSEGIDDPILETFLYTIAGLPRRVVLISTTGVYGDSKGEWIDENTPVNPTADRAKRRYSAEQLLQRWANKHDTEFMILRVPGIYALDRLPLARLKKELPVVQESEAGFTNRIHADDLAQICKVAMESNRKNEIFNATDGHPSTITDYFNQVADFAKLPRPPQITMQKAEQTLSTGMVSYLKESRRIRNNKMLELLKISLVYPSLKTVFENKK